MTHTTDAADAEDRSRSDEAASALLALGGTASLRVVRTTSDEVSIDVFTVQTARGGPLLPLVYDMQMEMRIKLYPGTREYFVSGRYFEGTGFSTSTQSFRGVYRRRDSGRLLALDGTKTVQFDTGEVYDLVEGALVPLGWTRRRGSGRRKAADPPGTRGERRTWVAWTLAVATPLVIGVGFVAYFGFLNAG